MFKQRTRNLIFAILSLLLSSTLPLSGHAAGSSGGGDIGGTATSNSRALTPEQQSGKAFRSGLKHRDRAFKHEAKAVRAKSDKARDKSLAKARKEYNKAIKKQGLALKHYSQNYKAANELGFALRKTGDYKKAIGAYNYALEINPNFHQATEYRGEAFLALGLFKQTMQSYMLLFRNDRDLASQLMTAIDTWLDSNGDNLEPAEVEFSNWVGERKRLAKVTADLSMNNTRSW